MRSAKLQKIFIIFIPAAIMAFSVSGCEKLKDVFIKPPPEEVIQKTYPFTVYTYQTSAVIKADGEDLVNYFLKDITWIEKASGLLEVVMLSAMDGADYTRVGETLDLKIGIAGITFPVRVTVIKYKPEKEMWLMVVTGSSWLLWRINVDPVKDGSIVSMYLFGVWSKALDRIISSFRLSEAGFVKFDVILAIAQAEFDPDLDIEELTEKGLRGKVYDAFHQGYEFSIRVDASPGEVTEWIFRNPENLNKLIPVLTLENECVDKTWMSPHPEEVIYCPCLYRLGGRDVNSNVITGGEWREGGRHGSYRHNFLVIALDSLVRIEVIVESKGPGSELKVVIYSELPGPDNPEAMDIMIGVAQTPEIMKRVLPEVKRKIEGN